MQKINPCLWFNHQAEEATAFYTSIFKNSKVGRTARYGDVSAQLSGQKKGSVSTMEFTIEHQNMLALNGGPLFKFSPALSFFVWCDTEEEITRLWQGLSAGGEVRMGLDTYPWAQKYGWAADKFGVEWQLILAPHKQKIAPAILFVEELFGKGEEAINFYTSIFPHSKIESIAHDEATKTVAHAIFSLNGQDFVLMEGQGAHNYSFTPAFSLTVNCETQKEVDTYWEKLAEGGSKDGCGWLTDKYGITWQITPTVVADLMADPQKADAVMAALVKMDKLDIKALVAAGEQV